MGSYIGVQMPWALAPLQFPSKWVSVSPHAAGTRMPVKVLPHAAAAVMLVIKAARQRKHLLLVGI